MKKLERSWRILKRSWTVLKENKRLLLFPIVNLILILAIFAFFLIPFAAFFLMPSLIFISGGELDKLLSGEDLAATVCVNLMLIVGYFVSMFLATFFNVAFYNEILKALNGNPVSITAGLRFAMTRWKAVLFWSLLAGVVGYLIKLLEEKLGFIGSWIMSFIGLAWSVACVFIAPVIIRDQEENNPLRCLKKSAGIIKRTWGEGLIGYIGVAAIGTLLYIAPFVVLIPFLIAVCLINVDILFSQAILMSLLFGFATWFVACMAFIWVCGVLEKIYIAALYIYGTEGVIPEAFDKETLDMAWKRR